MKKFILSFLVIAFLFTAGFIAISSYNYSEGHRDGYLMKFSKKGFIFKTYEGTLNLDFINTTGGRLSSNTWDFSVNKANLTVIDSLNNIGDGKIRFHYKQKVRALPWNGDTKYFVYKLEAVKDSRSNRNQF